jgi:hypothetical protein
MTPSVVDASIRMLATDAGGRSHPVRSGYRSLVRFGDDSQIFGFDLELPAESIAPGAVGMGTLRIWHGESMPPLRPGAWFEILEGERVVGQGTVIHASGG